MPELPEARKQRFQREYALSQYDAALLISSLGMANFYEQCTRELVRLGGKREEAQKLSASWITGELSNVLNADQIEISESGLRPEWLSSLLVRILDGTINRAGAKAIFPGMIAVARFNRSLEGLLYPKPEFSIDGIIESSGLKQISDAGAIGKVVDEVLAANPKQVEDYRAGKDKAFNSLVGQVMKRTQGKANPAQVNEILRRKLGG